MEGVLERIAENTRPKTSLSIVLSDRSTNFTTRFTPPIELNPKHPHQLALVNLETYNAIPNINDSNNRFTYSTDSGGTWHDIFIPTGSYGVDAINSVITNEMKAAGHYDETNDKARITIEANTNTLKSVMHLSSGYRADFRAENSIGSVLGFESAIYFGEVNVSENVVEILSVNALQVEVDVVMGSYVNGRQRNVIFSFFPDVPPGYKIVEKPINLLYLSVSLTTISTITVKLTDQNGDLVDLRGENLTMRFHLREA